MSTNLRSSETEPSLTTDRSPANNDLRTPFQSFKQPRAYRTRRSGLEVVSRQGRYYDVAADILGVKTGISNVYMIGSPGSSSWVLVDAGMPGQARAIVSAAERRFGAHVAPAAIILTHGHFDHVGSLKSLLARWDAPIYAHPLELPYLTGQSSYPPPDPSVGHGGMALLSGFYPRKPIDLGSSIRVLPPDGIVSQLPDWRWLPTPGHTPGHVSLFREDDRVLLAGDAFVTVRAESMMANLRQTPEMHGPPMYFTPDWVSARRSVQMLSELRPDVVATGHGIPLYGQMMQHELRRLVAQFDEIALPHHGRYVPAPARADHTGVLWVPPAPPQPGKTAAMIAGGVLAGLAIGLLLGPRRKLRWRDAF